MHEAGFRAGSKDTCISRGISPGGRSMTYKMEKWKEEHKEEIELYKQRQKEYARQKRQEWKNKNK